MLKETFDYEKYEKAEKTISIAKANAYAIFLMLPLAVMCFIIFVITSNDFLPREESFFRLLLWFLLFTVILLLLHEVTHGFFLGIFCERKFKSIKLGVLWKELTPYCHCKEILQINHMRIGYGAPLFTTGLLPFVISLLLGNFALMAASVGMIFGAGGDYSMLLLLFREKKNAMVEDHPSKIGCFVYRPLKPEVNP